MKYYGKEAYKGDVATNYEQDRVVESIWQKEQNWVSAFLKNVPDGSRILDLPVGSGRFIDLYAKKNITVSGFDISDDMVRVSNKKLETISNNKAHIVLSVGDAEKINLADNAIDYIICFRLFHLIPFSVIKKIIKEFYRVANKKIVIETFNSNFRVKPKTTFFKQVKNLLSSIKRKLINPKETPVPTNEPAKPWLHITNYYCDYNDLYNEFKKAGFTEILVDHIEDAENPVTLFTLIK